MSYPINLSIEGKPSPRTDQRIGSGRRKPTPLNANKSRDKHSNIFVGYEKDEKCRVDGRRVKGKVNAGVISKSDLENVLEITNRDKTSTAVYPGTRKPAPEGVPQLALGTVTGADEEIKYKKLSPREYKVHSPTSKEAYSWGTPLDRPNNNIAKVKGGGWKVNKARTATKPLSANRKHDDVPDLDLSKSNEGLQELRKAAQEVKDDLKIEYIGHHGNSHAKNGKLAKPDSKYNKKLEFVEKTLLQDQMRLAEEKPASTPPPFGLNERFDSRLKRHQDIHSTSAGPHCVEDNLSRRLHFGARIITLNDRDARRDVNGFFFANDKSLTIYEYRQFGTKSTALPLIHRGVYTHACGMHAGEPFCLLDITVGKDLTFATKSVDKLPESLKWKATLVFRVTQVSEAEKKKLLYPNSSNSKEKAKVEHFVKGYMEKEQVTVKKHQRANYIKNDIQEKIRSRGIKVFTNLLHHFKQINQSGDGVLSKGEFEKAMQTFHVSISNQNFDVVWNTIDRVESDKLDYDEFMRVYFGEMNEARKHWVLKAFSRIDPKKQGTGRLDDIKKFYNFSKDPKIMKGEVTERTALEELLECFQHTKNKTDVTFSEFAAYYEGLSMSHVDDHAFIEQIRTSWTI